MATMTTIVNQSSTPPDNRTPLQREPSPLPPNPWLPPLYPLGYPRIPLGSLHHRVCVRRIQLQYAVCEACRALSRGISVIPTPSTISKPDSRGFTQKLEPEPTSTSSAARPPSPHRVICPSPHTLTALKHNYVHSAAYRETLPVYSYSTPPGEAEVRPCPPTVPGTPPGQGVEPQGTTNWLTMVGKLKKPGVHSA